LTSVTLPASLKTIAQYAFNGCTSLTSITLPSSLTTIQKNAFYGSGLTDVSLPKTTTSIAIGAFGACNSLESFTVASGNTAYKAEDGVLYTLDGTIVCYPTAKKVEGGVLTITEDQSIGDGAFMGCLYIDEVVLPDGIEIIPQYAFYGSSIKKIDLPASLTEIKTYAFAQSALESVVIPETVEYIGSYAFAGSALKEAEILTTSSYASYSVLTSGAINYSYHAFTFSGCEQLEKVTFTEGIDRIGANMFEYCTSLKSFTIPASVTLVDSYAFRYSGLTSITIPETITKLGTSSFAGSALEEVEILTTNIMGTNNVAGATSGAPTAVFSDCQSLRSVKIPEGTIIIGASMFLNCTSLGSISLPSTLTNIYTSAFKGSGLKSIVIPDSVRTAADTITYGVAISAFEDCKSLETVTLSANMDRIVASTFSGCTALKTIVIPASIQDICSYAFKDCISLQNLIIPRTATSVGFSVTSSNVFEGMTEEQTIYFESSELEINAWWTFGWNAGCNAKIVFDYSADEQE
jgi:hypothetical protein